MKEATFVVEREIPLQAFSCLGNRVVSLQVDLLVFHAFPQPFDEHVVDPAAFAIHADPDTVALEQSDELRAGELAALIGIEDLGLAVPLQGVLDRLEVEIRGQSVGQPPGQHAPGSPIEYRSQVNEAFAHRDVGDDHGPDVVGFSNLQTAQQVRKDWVLRLLSAGIRPPIHRFDVHLLHPRGHVPAADLKASRRSKSRSMRASANADG